MYLTALHTRSTERALVETCKGFGFQHVSLENHPDEQCLGSVLFIQCGTVNVFEQSISYDIKGGLQ